MGAVVRRLPTESSAPDVGAFVGERLPILAQLAHPLREYSLNSSYGSYNSPGTLIATNPKFDAQ